MTGAPPSRSIIAPTRPIVRWLSGYASDTYDSALPGWRRVTRATHADGALPREEVLWLNPAAAEACSLFAEARQ